MLYCVKSLRVNSLIEYCETSIAIVLAQKEEKGDCNAGSSYYLCDLLDELQEVGTDEFTTARNLVKTEVEDDDNICPRRSPPNVEASPPNVEGGGSA